jgi:hypothetical protein
MEYGTPKSRNAWLKISYQFVNLVLLEGKYLKFIDLFSSPIHSGFDSSRNVAMVSTKPLTEMSSRNPRGGGGAAGT